MLDASRPIREQLERLSSADLEHAVSAILHLLGYVVLRNLHYGISGQPITEIDCLAMKILPYEEFLMAIECKGGGTPTDLLKFAGACKLIRPSIKKAFFVAQPLSDPDRSEFDELCSSLDISLIPKGRLLQFFAPILGPIPEKEEKISLMNELITVYKVEDALLRQASEHDDLRRCRKFFLWDVWRIDDPKERAETLYNEFLATRDLSCEIAEERGLNFGEELRTGSDEMVQCALLLQFFGRFNVVINVPRLAVIAATEYDVQPFLGEVPYVLRSAVVKLQENPDRLEKLGIFFQHWIKIWGGFLWLRERGREVKAIAHELSIREEDVDFFVDLLKELFYSICQDDSFITTRRGVLFFKLLPKIYEATGIKHRDDVFGNDYLSNFPYDVQQLLNYYQQYEQL